MSLFRPVLNAHALTEQQWRLIRILRENGEMEFNRLAETACILRPSLTGILNRLERDGIVSRAKNLPDQRKLCIALTDEGVRLFDAIMPEVDRIYREVIEQCFTPEELAKLFTLLGEVRRLADPGSDGGEDDEA